MAGFICTKCGTEHAVFGHGRIEGRVAEAGLDYLGSIPIDADVSPRADEGVPILKAAPDSPPANAIRTLASSIAARQSVLNLKITPATS